MGIILPRTKRREWLLTLGYRFFHILRFISPRLRLGVALDFSWLLDRYVHDLSFEHYDASSHPWRRESANFILDRITPSDSILDLGCGDGALSALLGKKAGRVLGVDGMPERIAFARSNYSSPAIQFEISELTEFVLKTEERFGAILLSNVIEHLDNPCEILRRCRRNAAALYVEVPDFECSLTNLYRVDLRRSIIYTDNDHVREFDRSEVRALLQESGWAVASEDHRHGVLRFWATAQPDN